MEIVYPAALMDCMKIIRQWYVVYAEAHVSPAELITISVRTVSMDIFCMNNLILVYCRLIV